MSTQNSLEEAFNKLSNDEIRNVLFELCLIASRGVADRPETMKEDIINFINENVYKTK